MFWQGNATQRISATQMPATRQRRMPRIRGCAVGSQRVKKYISRGRTALAKFQSEARVGECRVVRRPESYCPRLVCAPQPLPCPSLTTPKTFSPRVKRRPDAQTQRRTQNKEAERVPEAPKSAQGLPGAPRSARKRLRAPRNAQEPPGAPTSAQERPRAPRSAQERPRAPRNAQERPGAPGRAQERPGAPRSAQKRPGAPRSAQARPGAPRSAQERPGAFRSAPARSGALWGARLRFVTVGRFQEDSLWAASRRAPGSHPGEAVNARPKRPPKTPPKTRRQFLFLYYLPIKKMS